MAVPGELECCRADSRSRRCPQVPRKEDRAERADMLTCPGLELVCQSPAGRRRSHAGAAGEGLLPGLPLPVPSLPPAPEASGSRSAGSHEQGPHLEKGNKQLRKVPLPGRLREFCPPAQLYNPIGLPPFKQSKDWRFTQRGKDGW